MFPELAGGTLGIEPLEDLGQRLFGYARAGILDHDQDPVLALAGPDTDGIAIFTERDRIRDQIDEDLRQPILQTGDHDRRLRQIGDEVHPLRAPRCS